MIRRLRRVVRLPASDRRLLLRTLLLVAVIRIGLWLLPFRRVRAMLGRHTPVSSDARPPDPAIADKVAWAVEAAARCVPAATCLTQALAVQVLLARRGVPARLHIGVAKDEKRQLLAHAWVESEGRVIIGGCVAVSYTTLAVLEGENG